MLHVGIDIGDLIVIEVEDGLDQLSPVRKDLVQISLEFGKLLLYLFLDLAPLGRIDTGVVILQGIRKEIKIAVQGEDHDGIAHDIAVRGTRTRGHGTASLDDLFGGTHHPVRTEESRDIGDRFVLQAVATCLFHQGEVPIDQPQGLQIGDQGTADEPVLVVLVEAEDDVAWRSYREKRRGRFTRIFWPSISLIVEGAFLRICANSLKASVAMIWLTMRVKIFLNLSAAFPNSKLL